MEALFRQPHHDGSPTYLDETKPTLGALIGVRVRTSSAEEVREIWVRTVEDGEPFYRQCTIESSDETTVWWRGEVHVGNPVQGYRFMLVDASGYRWLNGAGVFAHDVPDANDFTLSGYDAAPDWGRDAVVYQIFPDRFARSAAAQERPVPTWARPAQWADDPVHEGPDTPLQFYGGDLDGVTEHLDHLDRVGADCVYLTPVFPGESNHRYNASTFDAVDPLLGGDAAYRRLIETTHDRGWRILADLTSNHTGDTHEWFLRARADAGSPERGFYYFDDQGGYVGWKGHDTLPKLDHTDPEVGRRINAVCTRWLDQGIDGWRIDVANMTGRLGEIDIAHEVARSIRRACTATRPDALVLAEHGHDASRDLAGDGWHGTMNYYGFSFPVWQWLADPARAVPNYGIPAPLPRRDGPAILTTMREFRARFGWRASATSWNILGSHDTPRIRTITGSADRQHAAIALQFALPGVPMIFAGDELGQEGTNGEDSRRTMPWADEATWDTTTLEVYRAFADLRREHPALRRGGLRWLHAQADLLVFAREHPDGGAVVAVSRGSTDPVALPSAELGMPQRAQVAFGAGSPPREGTLEIPAFAAAGATVWTW